MRTRFLLALLALALWYVPLPAQSDLLTSLISYWELEEASGTRADAHGSNNLADNNTVLNTTGVVGNAADFEADTSETLTIASNSSLQTGDIAFTFAGFIRSETVPGVMVFLSKDDNGSAREYGFYYWNGDVYFYVFGPGSENTEVAVAFSNATTYYVEGYHDPTANEIGIALNNGSFTTAAHTAGVRSSTAPFYLGARGDDFVFFDGWLDQWGFWKRLLTTDERTWLYNSGSGRSYADITAAAGGGVVAAPCLRSLLGVGRC